MQLLDDPGLAFPAQDPSALEGTALMKPYWIESHFQGWCGRVRLVLPCQLMTAQTTSVCQSLGYVYTVVMSAMSRYCVQSVQVLCPSMHLMAHTRQQSQSASCKSRQSSALKDHAFCGVHDCRCTYSRS